MDLSAGWFIGVTTRIKRTYVSEGLTTSRCSQRVLIPIDCRAMNSSTDCSASLMKETIREIRSLYPCRLQNTLHEFDTSLFQITNLSSSRLSSVVIQYVVSARGHRRVVNGPRNTLNTRKEETGECLAQSRKNAKKR